MAGWGKEVRFLRKSAAAALRGVRSERMDRRCEEKKAPLGEPHGVLALRSL